MSEKNNVNSKNALRFSCVVNRSHRIVSRGRCYDHNFLRFLLIFGEKIGVFLKNQCYDPIFAQFSFVLSKKRQFFKVYFFFFNGPQPAKQAGNG
jgi:hypothetical protein